MLNVLKLAGRGQPRGLSWTCLSWSNPTSSACYGQQRTLWCPNTSQSGLGGTCMNHTRSLNKDSSLCHVMTYTQHVLWFVIIKKATEGLWVCRLIKVEICLYSEIQHCFYLCPALCPLIPSYWGTRAESHWQYTVCSIYGKSKYQYSIILY